ncbi:class I SAM-dependent methyltransferase [Aggregicoccus sp. 17bor-14]|uniref:class I SAM-dependent methyltransferase n=1 Tax=Myxococcaceae TaxID=31 RepID=UPI00129C79DF|nr:MULTISPECIES: class I SAM-dependent methyltransferase [Myxococcaceae]MBF5043932.1 class I SAM-dependent methyltransferase [Simulacricoccus sp. 17bor-14]MRI89683.1 class I SAM-dependent methyltransferase [Aggregicoccus sp. 17bor-14]
MTRGPWWIERVHALLAPSELSALELGALWHLAERLQFVRENVEPALLALDVLAHPAAEAVWAAFVRREDDVRDALTQEGGRLAGCVRRGELGPALFRAGWETLGFIPNAEGGGTPADDYLDALFQLARYTLGEERPAFGMPNMSSRASRVSDFLAVTQPTADDVVFDLGSGGGKVALTVAASTVTRVLGVEYGGAYVASARSVAAQLGLGNAHFEHADVREVDLSRGSIFYLYYPFHGEVAQAVAQALGRLACEKDITVYASGPRNGFGEHFLGEVEGGALALSELRGEHSEVMVLRSARA